MPQRSCVTFVLFAAIAAPAGLTAQPQTSRAIEWTAYGHDPAGTRFSPARQITSRNVSDLRVAWTYRTGDLVMDDRTGAQKGRFEATPLFVDGTLFLATPIGNVIALDPESGAERWRFDAHTNIANDVGYGDFANRGVSTWLDPARAAGAPCKRRIFVAPVDARVFALDAVTGQPCADFAKGRAVDLTVGLPNPPKWKGEYEITSPPAVIDGLVIVGSAVADNQRTDAASGVVRAYDARTGALVWTWDPVPKDPNDPAYATWQGPNAHRTGAANAWSVMSVDSARDLVFVPVGSASPDYYGGERLGENRYSNSVVALHGKTGTLAWHFQVVHHDLWDYDVPAQPALVTIPRNGRRVDAVVVATKMGHLFILDRDTGKPLFPVEERPVPASDLAGERAWPNQPFPVLPAPLTPEQLTADDAFGITDRDRAACREWMAPMRAEGIFTPPSMRGTLVFPGNIGGSNWSGVAWDAAHDALLAPTNRLAFAIKQIPRDSLHAEAMRAPASEFGPQVGTPYALRRDALLSPGHLPCNPPPWGTLAAVSLATGAKMWESPLGWMPGAAAAPNYKQFGSINLGGVMVTAGGLVFGSGGLDQHLHAFDAVTGRELWDVALPAGGQATPMTYQTASGRQFVVISAGGHDRLPTTAGDYVIAFSLPATGEDEHARPRPAGTPAASLDGTWSGEVRVSGRRYLGSWQVAQRGDSVHGRFSGAGDVMNGSFAGTFSGDTLRIDTSWQLPARDCRGTFSGVGPLVNRGAMIDGRIRLEASCGEHPEVGTFILRRAAAGQRPRVR